MCESCIEPIPTCLHGEILAVDLNTTNSCCPQYYCGKCALLCCCVCVCLFFFKIFCLCIAVCDVNLCPESSVSCAPGLSLVQTAIAGHCCPQHHCGTHSETHTHIQYTLIYYSLLVSNHLRVDECYYLKICYACHILA